MSKNNFNNSGNQQSSELEQGISKVVSNPRKNSIILILVMLSSLFSIYQYFFKSDKVDEKKVAQQKAEEIKKVPAVKPSIDKAPVEAPVALPKLPEVPLPEVPQTPPPPPPLPPQPSIPSLSSNVVEEAKKPLPIPLPIAQEEKPAIVAPPPPVNQEAMLNRKKSAIMLAGGSGANNAQGGGNTQAGGKAQIGTAQVTKVSNSSYFVPAPSSAPRDLLSSLGEPSYVIAQGKIIDAVLESAINTDLSGPVRAIVSRDVYAESGKNILISRGSRLIGNYSAAIKRGQRRIDIVWKRVIMPGGIDIMIDSPAVDTLGRAGVDGVVDNKYFETLGNAILLSTLNIAVSKAATKITDAQSTRTVTQQDPSGGVITTQEGSPQDFAVQQAIKDFGETTKNLMQESTKLQPTIYVDQGSLIKIFVNKDLIFPSNLVNTRIVN
jgi:type IV secretion system protein VirB10